MMLVAEVRSDDEIEKLVNDNMPLAYYLAEKYRLENDVLDHEDRISAAMEGLHKAAMNWDENRTTFGTYASLRIRWWLMRKRLPFQCQKRGPGILHFSFDEPLGEETDSSLHDVIADGASQTQDNVEYDANNSRIAAELISTLPLHQRRVLILRFGLNGSYPKTLEDVAKVLRLTRERVRQIEAEALKKLRKKQSILSKA